MASQYNKRKYDPNQIQSKFVGILKNSVIPCPAFPVGAFVGVPSEPGTSEHRKRTTFKENSLATYPSKMDFQ